VSLAIAVFASGGGSNLQAILDHFGVVEGGGGKGGDIGRVGLVVTDRPGISALDRARAAGVEGVVVPVRGRPSGQAGEELLTLLRERGIGMIALAGYLSLLPRIVVEEYEGRVLNIHPALLPSFGGKGMYGSRIHEAVLEAGCRVSGVTIHYVDERYDTGPILLQWPVPVLAGDSPATLAARVLQVEHQVYPLVVELVARRLQGLEPEVEHLGPGRGEAAGEAALHFGLSRSSGPSVGEVWELLQDRILEK